MAASRPKRPLLQKVSETGNSTAQKASAGVAYRLGSGRGPWSIRMSAETRPAVRATAEPKKKQAASARVVAADFAERVRQNRTTAEPETTIPAAPAAMPSQRE